MLQVFVDEFTCIGCRNCNNVCPATFEMEDEYGRARVMRQGVDGGAPGAGRAAGCLACTPPTYSRRRCHQQQLLLLCLA